MDIIKQNRNLMIVIILLVVLNLSLITLLWLGRPEPPIGNAAPGNPQAENMRLEQLLKNELGFDDKQTEDYLKLRQEHHRGIAKLDRELQILKKQMFDEALQDTSESMLSDSLLQLVQKKQSKIERMTFDHFVALKKLCKPEQRKNLKLLMNEIFRRNPPRPEDGMPPPREPIGQK